MDNDFEMTMRKCNGMSAIRRAAEASKIIAAESVKELPLNQVAPLATSESYTSVFSDEQSEVVVHLATSSMVAEEACQPEEGGEGIGINVEADVRQQIATDAHELQHPAIVAPFIEGATCLTMAAADAIATKP